MRPSGNVSVLLTRRHARLERNIVLLSSGFVSSGAKRSGSSHTGGLQDEWDTAVGSFSKSSRKLKQLNTNTESCNYFLYISPCNSLDEWIESWVYMSANAHRSFPVKNLGPKDIWHCHLTNELLCSMETQSAKILWGKKWSQLVLKISSQKYIWHHSAGDLFQGKGRI